MVSLIRLTLLPSGSDRCIFYRPYLVRCIDVKNISILPLRFAFAPPADINISPIGIEAMQDGL